MTKPLHVRGIGATGYGGDGTKALHDDGSWKVPGSGGGGTGIVESVVAGTGIAVDSTDPANPIVSATGGGGGGSAGRVLISKIELATAGATMDFGTLPTTYEHLELVVIARSTNAGTSADSVSMTLNGDTTDANYSYRTFYGTTATGYNAGAGRLIGFIGPAGIGILTTPGVVEVRLSNYRGTAWHKTTLSQFHTPINATAVTGTGALTWKNTAAVTSLLLSVGSGANFAAGSVAWLYGLN